VSASGNGLEEREAEIAVLDDLLDQTIAGQGGLVYVEGPPGIGKTRQFSGVDSLTAAERRVTELHPPTT